MKRVPAAGLPRTVIDIGIVMTVGTLCLVTAYLLINKDAALIYWACFVYTSIAAWAVSATWLRSTIISLSALLFALAIADMVLSFGDSPKAASYKKGYSQPLRENGGELGYRPYPGREVQAWKTVGDRKVYDVTYTINEESYRQTPGFGASRGDRAPIVFFGGSFAYGEGVNDDETLPYFVAAETNWNRPVLNLAFSGYGPHQMLRSLELGKLRDLGFLSIQTAVYTAIPDHARRSAGEAWWDPVGPRYELDSTGAVHHRGRFNEVSDTFIEAYYMYRKVVQVARRSRTVDRTANLLFPRKVSDPEQNAHLMVEIIDKSAAIIDESYQGELVVVFWDDRSKISKLILEGLAEKNIRTIKMSDIIPLSQRSAYVIPDDNHPTAAANELIARELLQYLGDPDLQVISR